MNEPLAIAHTESSIGWGGQEIRTLTEAAGFIRRGHRVVVYAAAGARIVAEAPRFGVPIVTLPIGRKRLRGVRSLVRRARTKSGRHRQRAQLDRRLARRARVRVARAHASRGAGARPHAARVDSRAERSRDALAVSQGHRARRHHRRGAARAADPRQRSRRGARRLGADRHRRSNVRAHRRRERRAARTGAAAGGAARRHHRDAAQLEGPPLSDRRDAAAAARATRTSSSSATARSARRSKRRCDRARGCADASRSPDNRTTSCAGSARSTCSCCRRTPTKAFRKRCCRRCSRRFRA